MRSGRPILLLLPLLLAAQTAPPPPLGLTRVVHPRANPWSQPKADLGGVLFFDVRLSADGKIACASCHRPEHAFADARRVSTGVRGRETLRNTPSLVNRAYARVLAWDGRSKSIEEQAAWCLAQREVMDIEPENAAKVIAAIKGYQPLFAAAFNDPEVTGERITQALAVFIRTLVSGNSPYDRFMTGERGSLSEAAARGKDLFTGRANCAQCHRGSVFATDGFASVGVGMNNPPDEGRFAVTRNQSEWRLFRIPGLREVSRTAPYFHDGSVATIEEAIEIYDRGGEIAENKDSRLKPLHLSAQEKADLLEFLKSLEGEGWQQAAKPAKLPE